MKIDDLNYCLCTEVTDRTFPYLRVMLKSFTENNKWFDGDIIILVSQHLPFSKENRKILSSFYDKIKYIGINPSTYRGIVESTKTKNKDNLKHLYNLYSIEAFNLRGYDFVLYSNHLTLFTGDVSHLFNHSSNIVSVLDSYVFPDAVNPKIADKQCSINSNLMLISKNVLQSDIFYKLKSEVMVHRDTLKRDSHKPIISKIIRKSEFSLKLLDNTTMAKKMSFPDPKFSNYTEHEKTIKSIELDVGILEKSQNIHRSRFTSINRIWSKYNHDLEKHYSPDINKRKTTVQKILKFLKNNNVVKNQSPKIEQVNVKNSRSSVLHKGKTFKQLEERYKLSNMNGIKGYTFILTFRRTNEDRFNNLIRKIQWINSLNVENKEIIIIEQDGFSKIDFNALQYKFYERGSVNPALIKFKFIKNNGLFNRSWGFNVGYKMASYDNLIFSDSDVIYSENDYINSLRQLNSYDAVSPSLDQIDLNRDITNSIEISKSMYSLNYNKLSEFGQKRKQKLNLASGTIIIKKEAFEKIGFWNENFEGWGGDDDFLTLKIQEYPISYIDMNIPMFHLYHERSNVDGNGHAKYKNNVNIINEFKLASDKSKHYNIAYDKIGNVKKYEI